MKGASPAGFNVTAKRAKRTGDELEGRGAVRTKHMPMPHGCEHLVIVHASPLDIEVRTCTGGVGWCPLHHQESCYDAYDAVKWCAQTASPTSNILLADSRKTFIVGIASAGGNHAAVMCQIARDEALEPPVTGQYLCVLALLSEEACPEKWKNEYRSGVESTDDPVLKLESRNKHLDDLGAEASDWRYSPLLHPNLKGLPPAFFQFAGLDPLGDEGLMYERVSGEECGVPTKLEVYDGYGHMFWTNWPRMKRSLEFVDATLDGCSMVA